MTDEDRRYWEAASLAALTGLVSNPATCNEDVYTVATEMADSMLLFRNNRVYRDIMDGENQ
jgi:hypothetical protein